METKSEQKRLFVSLFALILLSVYAFTGVAGSLEPDGPPAPTMKTLNEVEPRIPIHASDLPLVIIEPNSYYLVEDVNFANTTTYAIEIKCDDVTIDLMGYTIKGPNLPSYSGIYALNRTGIEVRNGVVRDFANGVYLPSNRGSRVIHIRSVSNMGSGIAVLGGTGNLIKDCASVENNTYGFYSGAGCTITDCIAYKNGNMGFIATAGCILTGNTAYENNNHGFYTGSNCTISGNAISDNGGRGILAGDSCTVTGNTVYNNSGDGISTGSGSTITGNTCHDNDGDGISADAGCTITGNTCYSNNNGITINSGGTIVGNTARSNTNYGIDAGSNCLIDQNTAYNNGTNLSAGAGCVLGINCAP